MITILEGDPGHGKSYTLVKGIADAVHKGEPVATNVPLRADWAEQMARHFTILGRWRKDAVARKADKYRCLVVISDDFDELLKVRLHGDKEGRGKMILDEFHNEANTRSLHKDSNRKNVVKKMSGHRHYGWDMLVATQDQGNIDTQIRSLAEFVAVVRNFKRLPWAPIWFNLFLLVTRWDDKKRTKAGLKVYLLSKRLASLYDTHGLAALDDDDEVIWLPSKRPLPREPLKVGAEPADTEVCQPTVVPQAESEPEWVPDYRTPPPMSNGSSPEAVPSDVS